MRVVATLCAVVVALPLLAADEVTTITFDGVLAPEQEEELFFPTYVVDGWAFTGWAAFPTDFRILADGFATSNISNGTDWGFVQNAPIFELERVSGAPFDLISLDLGQAFGSTETDGTVTVTGRFADDSDLAVQVAAPGAEFQTHAFDESWRDLVSLNVASDTNFLAVDNVVLECGIFIDGFETGSTDDWSAVESGVVSATAPSPR